MPVGLDLGEVADAAQQAVGDAGRAARAPREFLRPRRIDPGGDRGIPGGLWPSPPEGDSRVQLFVEVDDVAATVARAAELGFFVVVPPQVLPEGDELAIIADEEGISFGIQRRAS